MDMMIVGNCQVVGLRDLIYSACPDLKIEAVEVWNKTPEQLASIAQDIEKRDVVVSQPYYSPQYAGLTKAFQSRSASQKSLTIHNIYWNVSTPDCGYVGRPKPLNSPVMNYHSRSVLNSFLAGEPEETALEKLGRYNEQQAKAAWDTAVSALREREKGVSVPFCDELIERVKKEVCFFVPNHPKIELIEAYANKILQDIFPGTRVPKNAYVDRLKMLGSFPVYKGISDNLGLPVGDEFFTVKTPNGLEPMSPEKFVSDSYKIYSSAPRESLV